MRLRNTYLYQAVRPPGEHWPALPAPLPHPLHPQGAGPGGGPHPDPGEWAGHPG
jgi:hypothetical protein